MDRRQRPFAAAAAAVGALAGCAEAVSRVDERTGGQVEDESERAVDEAGDVAVVERLE